MQSCPLSPTESGTSARAGDFPLPGRLLCQLDIRLTGLTATTVPATCRSVSPMGAGVRSGRGVTAAPAYRDVLRRRAPHDAYRPRGRPLPAHPPPAGAP